MTVSINGTSGIVNDATDLNYTGTLTGGTGVVNLGSGQVYKDASGNVGIGTATPNRPLSILRGAGVGAYIDMAGNGNTLGSSSFVIGQGEDDTAYVYNRKNSPMAFATNNTERARIDSSGNLLVGTTSVLGASAAGATHIVGGANDANQSPLYLRNPFSTAGRNWRVGPTNNAGFIIFNDSGTGQYMTYGATSWTATSDERLKTNLLPIENAAQKISSLRAVTGRYKTDGEGVSRSFLIAQDVQAVLPEAVDVQDDEQNTLGLRYTEVIPLLVAAIKEQQTLITALTARITALEGTAA